MEPVLRSTQVLKQEAADIGLMGKYVTRQQTLDREDRGAWRDAQNREVDIRMAELQAEDKKRADEIHMADIQSEAEEKKRADDIKIQMAKIEADKDLALKELELKAQQDQASISLAAAPPLLIKMSSPQSYHP